MFRLMTFGFCWFQCMTNFQCLLSMMEEFGLYIWCLFQCILCCDGMCNEVNVLWLEIGMCPNPNEKIQNSNPTIQKQRLFMCPNWSFSGKRIMYCWSTPHKVTRLPSKILYRRNHTGFYPASKISNLIRMWYRVVSQWVRFGPNPSRKGAIATNQEHYTAPLMYSCPR